MHRASTPALRLLVLEAHPPTFWTQQQARFEDDAALVTVGVQDMAAGVPAKDTLAKLDAILWVSGDTSTTSPPETTLPWDVIWCDDETPHERDVDHRLRTLLARLQARQPSEDTPRSWQELLEASPDGWLLFDHQLVLRYANPATERLTGAPLDALLGHTSQELGSLLPEDRFRAEQALRACLRGERIAPLEVSFRHKDGSERTVEALARRVSHQGAEVLVTLRDISRRKAVERALRESEERFQRLASVSSEGIVIHDNGTILDVNQALAEMIGYNRDEMVGTLVSDWVAPSDHPTLEDLQKVEDELAYTLHVSHRSGDPRVLQIRSRDFPSREGRWRVATVRNITEQTRDAEQRKMAEFVLQGTRGVLVRWSPESGTPILWISDQIRQFGYDPQQLMRERFPFEKLLHPDDLNDQLETRTRLQEADEELYSLTYRLRTAGGTWRWVDDLTVTTRDPLTGAIERRGLLVDVTAQREAEARVQELSQFDTTTGLANRTRVLTLASRHWTSDTSVKPLAFLVLDIDRFHRINDSLGHEAGDEILRQIGKNLALVAPPKALVGRLAGDEFVVALRVAHRRKALMAAEQLQRALSQTTFRVADEEVHITFCVGIALAHDADELTERLRHAQTAVVEAKNQGRGQIEVYETHLSETRRAHLHLDTALRRALDEDEIILHYQPQIDREQRTLVGAEALARWNHPTRGLLLPGDFIPFAENDGLIEALGSHVLRMACAQLAQWRDLHGAAMRISVNLSAPHFLREDLHDEIATLLRAHSLPGSLLELEVTESLILQSHDTVVERLTRLGELGVRIMLDDFGTGHSSMAYLRQLPIHGFKIDQSFLVHVPELDRDAQILRSMLRLGSALGLEVVAEGIERPEQALWLEASGCKVWQGNLIGHPTSADAFAKHWFNLTGNRARIAALTELG